jgi:hypothetical protein
MVSAMIAQKGYLEIPFKQYVGFSNTHSGSTRFTVATQSLDRIWFAFRNDNFATQGAPHRVKGFQKEGAFTSTATIAATQTAGAVTQDIGISEYNGLLDTNKEKYIGAHTTSLLNQQPVALQPNKHTNFNLRL